jgi:hypothetical protein
MTTNRLGAVMKTSTILTETLAATILLACSAATPTQAEVTQASEASHNARFTDYELKNLIVFKRPNIAVASPAVLARALKMAPVEKPITQCATSPSATRVVKLRINNNFHVKNTGHDVVSKRPAGGGVKSVQEPALNADSTTYDMKFDKTVWDAHGQVIAVKVILKDRDLVFLSDEESVTTVNTTTGSMFICLDKVKSAEDKNNNAPDDDSDTGQDQWDQATFYVDETKIQTQKFNIRVIVRHQDHMHVLPIIIDPVVENNGFN